jgi:predicted nucleic acid-binding Zn ribbon protein
MQRHDDEADDLDDRDLPLESDVDDDADGPAVVPCPHCGKSIHEQAEWCHHCGQYLSREDAPRSVPLWILIGAAAVALILTAWIITGR